MLVLVVAGFDFGSEVGTRPAKLLSGGSRCTVAAARLAVGHGRPGRRLGPQVLGWGPAAEEQRHREGGRLRAELHSEGARVRADMAAVLKAHLRANAELLKAATAAFMRLAWCMRGPGSRRRWPPQWCVDGAVLRCVRCAELAGA